MSLWESRAAIEAFAGQDIDKAVFYPDDEQFLIERDLTVRHYEVAGTEQAAQFSRGKRLQTGLVERAPCGRSGRR
jgi:hypothetical protein